MQMVCMMFRFACVCIICAHGLYMRLEGAEG